MPANAHLGHSRKMATVFEANSTPAARTLKANFDQMLASDDPDVKRFLGVEKGNSQALGLGESGPTSSSAIIPRSSPNCRHGQPLKLEHGPNRLYRDSGLKFPLGFN
jgi:general L-amino acid transport system substrate-binding protein